MWRYGPGLIATIGVVMTILCADQGLSDTRFPLSRIASPSAEIAKHSHRLMAAMRRGDLPSARSRLRYLIELRKTSHIGNLTSIAAAFLSRFDVAVFESTPEEVYSLAAISIGLAPDYPQLRFNLSLAYLGGGIRMLGPAMRSFIEGVSAYARYPRGMAIEAGNASFYLLFSVIIMTLVVSTILLLRHVRTLAHDIGDMFPSAPSAAFSASEVAKSRSIRFLVQSGIMRTLTSFVVLLLLVLPAISGIGLLIIALIWTLFISVYSRRAELVTIVLINIGIMAILPLSMLSRLSIESEKGTGSALWSCLMETCRPHQVNDLIRMQNDNPHNSWMGSALAMHYIHDGVGSPRSLNDAAEVINTAIPDSSGTVSTIRGNANVLNALSLCPGGQPQTDSIDTARQSYESALRAVPEMPEAYRGLAIVEGIAGNREAMETAISRLVQVSRDNDLSFIAKIRTLVGTSRTCSLLPSVSSMLRTPSPPHLSIYFGDIRQLNASALPLFGKLLLGHLPIHWLPIVAAISMMFLMFVAWTGRRYSFAYTCPRCGGVSCIRCNVEASGFDYCPTCLLEQVRPAFLDPLDLVALQRKRDRKLKWGSRLLPLVSMVIPGSGQILMGRPLRGLFMIGCLAFSLGFVVYHTPPMVDSTAYIGRPGSELPWFPPVLLGMVYLFSAVDVWQNRQR